MSEWHLHLALGQQSRQHSEERLERRMGHMVLSVEKLRGELEKQAPGPVAGVAEAGTAYE